MTTQRGSRLGTVSKCHGITKLLTSFTTVAPGKVWKVNKGVEEVEECPGDHDDVVDVLEEDHHDGGVAHALEYGGELANHWHSALADVLTHGHLEEEKRDPTHQHWEEVWDQERAWSKRDNFNKTRIF